MSEREVTINADDEVYVVEEDDGRQRTAGFDEVLDALERVVLELVGRGVLPDSFLEGELEAVKARRGTLAAFDTLLNLRDQLARVCEQQEDPAVCDLSPQLAGYEGREVEVVDGDGERRAFTVGKTEGWVPHHVEIGPDWQRPAELEYESVTLTP